MGQSSCSCTEPCLHNGTSVPGVNEVSWDKQQHCSIQCIPVSICQQMELENLPEYCKKWPLTYPVEMILVPAVGNLAIQ